ncbi:phosphohistidine phosphatase SixA [Pseudidiomarina sp. WS423]|uniref:phosphohistidine phosphatase SixA n=1 Tax=Pseudidiomarina sp. WS423 TaxID=3425124 RepID=UPI003D6E55BF
MTITLYLMRHGDAVAAQALQADAIRPLSPLGEEEVLAAATWLQQYLAEQGQSGLDWLLVSPYIRAQQTATIVAQTTTAKVRDISHDITPAGDADMFTEWLWVKLAAMASTSAQVMVVSHMPFISYLVAALDQATPPLIFPTAGIAELQVDIAKRKISFVRMIAATPAE